MFSKASSPAAREREEERGETGGVCWDNWIEAIRRRKEGNSEIRREVDDGKTGAGRGGVAK